jgi:hypothetical protein
MDQAARRAEELQKLGLDPESISRGGLKKAFGEENAAPVAMSVSRREIMSKIPVSVVLFFLTAMTPAEMLSGQMLQVVVNSHSAVGGGSPFDPSMLSGLQVWYAADSGSNCGGVCSDGSSQTTWADKSSNANNLSAGSCAHAPIYHTNQLNGKPAVTFNGSGDCFAVGAAINLQTASTVFAVVKLTSTASVSGLIGGTSGGYGVDLAHSSKEQSAIKDSLAL